MQIDFNKHDNKDAGHKKIGTLVYFAFEEKLDFTAFSSWNADTVAQLKRAVSARGFKGKFGEIITVTAPTASSLDTFVLMGLGVRDKLTLHRVEQLGGKLTVHLQSLKVSKSWLNISGLTTKTVTEAQLGSHLACGLKLRNYSFEKYKSKSKDEDPTIVLKNVTVITLDDKKAGTLFADLNSAVEGNLLARDLVTEPSNVLYPKSYAAQTQALTKIGLEVEVLGEAQMQKLGMNALLAVGQGSARESQLVIMKWNGSKDADETPLAFVGKGVTFDTGGISLKPANNMGDMKFDMGGSAAVVGLMQCLAQRKAPVNVVGVVGLVENMPSSSAFRPGDVVTAMNGKTIEIANTDAEGRLVLADALYYTQSRFKPKYMINLATLTGAIVVSFGTNHAGLFSNDDGLSESLTAAGLVVGEHIWRMPMGEAYAKMIKSDIADISNLGAPGAGSITAAQLLENFVGDTKWAHLDIAGTVWLKANSDLSAKGATGFGVRLLDQWVNNL